MAESKCLREEYLKEYWELVLARQGVCKTSRESVRESIICYDTKEVRGYKGDYLQSMCRYKLARVGWEKYNIDSDSLDCDVAYITLLQYAIAFPFVLCGDRRITPQKKESTKYEVINPENEKLFRYRGDTMNSFSTVMHAYFKQYAHDDGIVKDFLAQTKNNRNIWGVEDESEYVKKFYKYKLHWEACILDNHDYFDAILPEEAKRYIAVIDTIGNFVPVPFVEKGIEFNSPRGYRNSAINDYWDLTLWHIYLWYQLTAVGKYEEADGHLLAIVKNKDSVEMCRKWLESFGSWPSFVRANYMEAFVKDGYGEPKELWKGHFTRKGSPTTPEEFSEFFINTSTWIMERGNTIAQVIMGELESSSIDCPWKNQEE